MEIKNKLFISLIIAFVTLIIGIYSIHIAAVDDYKAALIRCNEELRKYPITDETSYYNPILFSGETARDIEKFQKEVLDKEKKEK